MQETNTRFYVVCDTSASMAYRGSGAWGSKLECARILAAALTWFMLRQNDAAGLIALQRDGKPSFVRPSQNPSQFGEMLRQLDRLEPAGGSTLRTLLDHAVRLVHRRSVILFFSDLLEPAEEIELHLKQLRFHGHECLVFQVLDGDEIEFPFAEARTFEDLETGGRRQVQPAAVRKGYLERFAAFMQQHRDLLQTLEIPHCQVRTDESPWPALARFLSERRRLN
jgi:uncharacterized protein (DUF58 family)